MLSNLSWRVDCIRSYVPWRQLMFGLTGIAMGVRVMRSWSVGWRGWLTGGCQRDCSIFQTALVIAATKSHIFFFFFMQFGQPSSLPPFCLNNTCLITFVCCNTSCSITCFTLLWSKKHVEHTCFCLLVFCSFFSERVLCCHLSEHVVFNNVFYSSLSKHLPCHLFICLVFFKNAGSQLCFRFFSMLCWTWHVVVEKSEINLWSRSSLPQHVIFGSALPCSLLCHNNTSRLIARLPLLC